MLISPLADFHCLFNILLQWAKSGSHRVFLNKSSLKQKYTPHTHGYGLKENKTPVPYFASQNDTLFTSITEY
jgi:hypothetical protein